MFKTPNQTKRLFVILRRLAFISHRVLLATLLCFVLLGVFSYTRVGAPARVEAAVGINPKINFQGKLVNPNGTNVTDGSYSIVFSIYTVASGGSNIWTETQSPTVTNGIFQVDLGGVTALPGSVDFNTDNIYLGIKVGADAEMTPRVQFTAVPQAFNAEKLGGLDKTGYIQNTVSQQASSNFNISGAGVVGTSLTTPTLQSAAATALTITGNAASTWSTSAGALTIQTTGANLQLQTASSGDITLTTATGTGLANVLTGNLKVGTGTAPDVTLNGEDAYIEGTLEVDSASRFDGTVTLNGVTTANTDVDLTFAGTENLAVTSDLAGTVDLISVIGTPSASAGTTRGLLLQQTDSANTNGLDTALLINNADTDLAVTTGIQFTSSGGGFTTFLDTPTIDITGAGAITGGTAITSSGTITFSGLSTAGIVTNTAGGVLGTTNAVAANLGGTGFNSYAIGDLLYANSTSTLAKLADVATGSCLISGGVGVAPSWGTCGSGGTLQAAYDGGNTITSAAYSGGRNIDITLADTATDSIFRVTQAGTANAFEVHDTGNFSDTTPFVIDQNGNVGIGTTLPRGALDVSGTVYLGDTGVTHAMINSNDGFYFNSEADNNGSDGSFHFATDRWGTSGGTEFLTILNGGNTGISTTAPDRKLEVNSATGANLRLTYNDADGSAVSYADLGTASTGGFNISANNLTATGAYGIQGTFTVAGTAASQTYYGNKLSVTNNQTTNANTLYGQHISFTDAGSLANTLTGLYVDATTTNSADTTYAAVFQGGSVGIGTAAPTARLHVVTTQPVSVAGNGTAGTTALTVAGGAGGDTSGITGQTAGAGSALGLTTGAGGAATGTSGTNIGGAGGAVTINTGNGGNATSGIGGTGGSASITSGNGGNGSGANANGNGGAINLTAGNGGTGGLNTSGTGGTVTIKGGNGVTTNASGGNVILQGGTEAGGSGTEGSVIVRAQSAGNATSNFIVQNSASAQIFGVDTVNSQVLIGRSGSAGNLVVYGSTNSVIITAGAAAQYTLILPTSVGSANQCLKNSGTAGTLTFGICGNAAGTNTIILVPEYAGAVITPDGSNNSGTMTADYDSAGVGHNYYEWSTDQATAQDYNVVLRYALPSNFSSFTASSWKIWTWNSTTTVADSDTTVTVKDEAGTTCTNLNGQSVAQPSANTWNQKTLNDPTGTCTFEPDTVITVIFNMKAKMPQTNKIRIGELSFVY